jgi:hypothetical protein
VNPDRTDPLDVAGDLRSRILAAVRAEPAPTRHATLLRNALLLAAGGAVALAIFSCMEGVRVYERPTLLVVATSSGWFLAAAVATRIAFARGRSMLGRPTAWLVALVVGAPFLLLAWKLAVTAPFGTSMMAWWGDKLGLRCLGWNVVIGLVLLAVLTAARRRSDPLRPGITGAALGMAAGIAGGFFIDLWCPVAHVGHLLLGHILPLVLLAALGALAGRRFIRLGNRIERPASIRS